MLEGAVVCDEREGDELQIGEVLQDGLRREDAVGVELYALATDGDGEVEAAAGGEDALERGHEFEAGVGVDGVSVPAEAEVFCDVEAGERGDGVGREIGEVAGVVLQEGEARDVAGERANVYDGDGHEGEQMGDEAIHAGADVYVLRGTLLEDFARGPEVLMEVVAAGGAGTAIHVCEDGEGVCEAEPEGGFRLHFFVFAEIAEIGWQSAQRLNENPGIEAG